jgi:hypothetical protein
MPPVFHSNPHHPALPAFVRDPDAVQVHPVWAVPTGRDLDRALRAARGDPAAVEDLLTLWVGAMLWRQDARDAWRYLAELDARRLAGA